MIGPDLVVSVRDDEEDAKTTNAAAEEPEELERCPVGPVGILADDHRGLWPRGERSEHLPEEPFTRMAIEGVLIDRYAEQGRQVAHGTEWGGRGEPVARGTQHGCFCATGERVDQRGLADPGLAAHEDHAPVPRSGLAQMFLKVIKVLFALE
jgi:hypothetical protein